MFLHRFSKLESLPKHPFYFIIDNLDKDFTIEKVEGRGLVSRFNVEYIRTMFSLTSQTLYL